MLIYLLIYILVAYVAKNLFHLIENDRYTHAHIKLLKLRVIK